LVGAAENVLLLDDAAEPRRVRGTRRVAALGEGARAVVVADLARASARRFGSLQRHLTLEVLPALEERGLFEVRSVRYLWCFRGGAESAD